MRGLLFAFFCLWMTCAAGAQTFEIAPLAGYYLPPNKDLGSINDSGNKDDDTKMRGGYGYGLRFTLNTPGYYGYEAGFVRSQATLNVRLRDADTGAVTATRNRIHNQLVFLNFLMYMMPSGERWRPYITVGGHMIRYGAPRLEQWTHGSARTYGGNFGGGIKLKVVNHVLLRFDVRDYIGGSPYDLKFEDTAKFSGGMFRQLEGSLGIAIAF